MPSNGPDTIVPSRRTDGHSTEVRIRLHVNGQTYPLAQVGLRRAESNRGGRLIFDSPVTFPAAATGTRHHLG